MTNESDYKLSKIITDETNPMHKRDAAFEILKRRHEGLCRKASKAFKSTLENDGDRIESLIDRQLYTCAKKCIEKKSFGDFLYTSILNYVKNIWRYNRVRNAQGFSTNSVLTEFMATKEHLCNNTEYFLSHFSFIHRKIIQLLADGYTASEIDKHIFGAKMFTALKIKQIRKIVIDNNLGGY